ncbi:MAG TPA: hypothetical protein VM030_09335 [Acidimicrobiales bacterium]|nr:hypothetical protein [Acidimicrobiales bacterium]
MNQPARTPTSVRALSMAVAVLLVAGIAAVAAHQDDEDGLVAGPVTTSSSLLETTTTTEDTTTTVALPSVGDTTSGSTDPTTPGGTPGGPTTGSGATTTTANGGTATTARPGQTTTTTMRPASAGPAITSAGIYTVQPDGSGLRQAVPGAGNFATASPTSGQIAYARPALGIANQDGSGRRGYATNSLMAPPTWSSDSKEVAIVVANGNGFALNVVAVDGSGQRQVANNAEVGDVSGAAWSPNGDPIAFIAGGDVYVVKGDGTGLRQLINVNNAYRSIAWSGDGKKLAFTHGDKVAVINLDGTGFKDVGTTDRTTHGWSDVTWSKDSTRLVYVAGTGGASRLMVVGHDGTGPRNIAENAEAPRFSPDGGKVAMFSVGKVAPDGDFEQDLELADPDRASYRFKVVEDQHGASQSWGPVWSGDGSLIIFTIGGGSTSGIGARPPA